MILFKYYRKELLKIGANTSELRTNRVPQGSILRPLLFIVYINDICQHNPRNTNTIIFSDNTSFINIFSNSITCFKPYLSKTVK